MIAPSNVPAGFETRLFSSPIWQAYPLEFSLRQIHALYSQDPELAAFQTGAERIFQLSLCPLWCPIQDHLPLLKVTYGTEDLTQNVLLG